MEAAEAVIDYTTGILNPHIKKYHMVRTPPCEALQPLIEFFYEISWNMPTGEKQLLESLPAPSVHLIFMNGEAEIAGQSFKIISRACINRMKSGFRL